MSHVSSAVLAITGFAAPVVALAVVSAKTGGAPRRTVARVGSVGAAAVSVLVALVIAAATAGEADPRADAIMLVLSLVPGVPWLLLHGDKPGETPLVFSMLIAGALVAAFALIGLITTFGATFAESTNIGAGPAGLFVVLPAGAYVMLELKVFLAVKGMLAESQSAQATKAAAARARQPMVASPKDAPLRIQFDGCDEITPGSPYQSCMMRLEGEWTPELPTDGWLRISAFSPDRRFVGLAHWDVRDESPGFYVVTMDCAGRTFDVSNRIDGFCQSLAWSDDKFVPLVWHAPRR